MSRSRPNENAPNPAVRWFDWHGEKGVVTYYDKDAKKSVEVPLPFTCIVLDQLSAVRGWDDSTKSGIFSNAVRDTREEVMTVKSFKGGVIAEGRYKDIKATVNAAGGHFETQIYIGFRHQNNALAIGVLSLKGAALSSWMDFSKAHRAQIQHDAVKIVSTVEGQKGRVKFRTPVFETHPISEATNDEAVKLDAVLQSWLDGYFKRNQRSAPAAPDAPAQGDEPDYEPTDEDYAAAVTADDVPW